VVLICICLMINDDYNISCVDWPSLEKIYSDPLLYFNWVFFFFSCWVLSILYTFWLQVPYQIDDFHIFLPIL